MTSCYHYLQKSSGEIAIRPKFELENHYFLRILH